MIKCKVNNIECSQCTPCCGNRIELKNIDISKVPKEEQVEKVVEEFQEFWTAYNIWRICDKVLTFASAFPLKTGAT